MGGEVVGMRLERVAGGGRGENSTLTMDCFGRRPSSSRVGVAGCAKEWRGWWWWWWLLWIELCGGGNGLLR